MADPDLAARLERLEARLDAVEQTGPQPKTRRASETEDVDAPARSGPDFWALDGLIARVGDAGAVVWAGQIPTDDGAVRWQYGLGTEAILAGGEEERVDVAERLAALGHPARLAIVAAVLGGSHRLSDLVDDLGLGSSGQIYHHVRTLTATGWLQSAGRGQVAVPPHRAVNLLVALGAAS